MGELAPQTARQRAFARKRMEGAADALAVALAFSLPWSTSATGILALLWLITLVPTLDIGALRRVLATPAGALPVALWLLGAMGMLWAEVPLAERLDGLGGFHKLLCIPLLMVQFERSARGVWVLYGFLSGCALLLVTSFAQVLVPALAWSSDKLVGIPVKDTISQNTLFTVCAFLLADRIWAAWRRGQRGMALALGALALGFVANLLFVTFTRTTVVLVPILMLLFGFVRFGAKGGFGLVLAGVLVAALAWPMSQPMRFRIVTFFDEVARYRVDNERSSAAERLEFWKKSIGFVARAPIIGHGTGSTASLFREAAQGQSGVAAVASVNPHNQVLAVAIPLGFVGVVLLAAMWLAHLWLFRFADTVAWVGLLIVTQNVVSAAFHSHLFDFTHGWLYVIGVGAAAGAVRKEARRRGASEQPP